MMKERLSLLLFSLLFLGSFTVQADPLTASDIRYRCLGGDEYEITSRFIYDCSGGPVSNVSAVYIDPLAPCTGTLTRLLNLRSVRDLPTVCAALDTSTTCTGGTYAGYQEVIYQGVVNLAVFNGCGWRINHSYCCGNPNLTNISNPGIASAYAEAALLMPNLATCNHSPQVNALPIFTVCDGVLQNTSYAMLDHNGDSLVYQLGVGGTSIPPINYLTGFSDTQPLSTANGFQFNTVTGQTTFTPTGVEGTFVDLVVFEYRNGALIGYTRRPTQVIVQACSNSNMGFVLQNVDRLVHGNWVSQGRSTDLPVCPGSTVHLRATFTDPDAGDTLVLSEVYTSLQATYPMATLTPLPSAVPNQLTIEMVLPNVRYDAFVLGLTDRACAIPNLQTFGFNLIPSANCALLTGLGFVDANNSCTRDPSEALYANYVVRLTRNGVLLTFPSDGQGRYASYLDTGTYQVEVVPVSPYHRLCPSLQTVTILAQQGVVTLDLPLQETASCPYMSVNIGAPVLVHCSDNYYSIRYCNYGTLDAVGAYVDVFLDSLFVVDSTTHPIGNQQQGVYRFDLDTLVAGDCGVFQIFGHLDPACDLSQLGNTYCGAARIYPDTFCNLWSGPALELEGICTGDSIRFRVNNIGQQAMGVPASHIVIEDNVILHSGPNISLGAGASSAWYSYFADGATLRAEIAQDPSYPWSNKASATVSGCISPSISGLPSRGFTNVFSLNDGRPSFSIDCQESVAAYDPNDKQGFPLGYSLNHYIEPHTDLEYRIRFQNTGTYYATDVVLRDTLSPHLDHNTLQLGAASHAYTWRLVDNHILEVTFQNIHLPDSGRDFAGSQGFIDLRIQQQATLPLGTVINNRAAIYFDRNPPILTNTTLHTIGENFILFTDLPALADEGKGMRITAFPNPFDASTTIQIEGGVTVQVLQLEVYNALGQLVKRVESPSGQSHVVLQRDGLEAGIYFYRLQADGLPLHSGQLVVKSR